MKSVCLLLFFIYIQPIVVYAHPHVFIECELTVIFDDNGLLGFHNQWTFDKMFSENILYETIPEYQPGQLTLSPTDIDNIQKGAFNYLSHSNYFTHIIDHANKVEAIQAQDFVAKLSANQLIYEFFIPYSIPSDDHSQTVTVSIFDSSYYSSITISSILITDSNALDITYVYKPIDGLTYYMGQLKAKGAVIHFKKKQPSHYSSVSNENTSDTMSSENDKDDHLIQTHSSYSDDHLTHTHSNQLEVTSIQSLIALINEWQNYLKNSMTVFAKDIQKTYWCKSFVMFLLFSLCYGIIHALGPGHGKSIVMSYFIARPGNILSGIILSFALSLTHVTSGVVIVIAAKELLESPNYLFSTSIPIEKISYALLIVIGVFLFIHAIIEIKNHAIIEIKKTEKNQARPDKLSHLLGVAFSTGMIPCPAAAIVIVFSISFQIIIPGLIAIFLMGVGMGLTTSMFALLAIMSRTSISKLTSQNQNRYWIIHSILSISGAVIIILFGIVMCYSSYQQI